VEPSDFRIGRFKSGVVLAVSRPSKSSIPRGLVTPSSIFAIFGSDTSEFHHPGSGCSPCCPKLVSQTPHIPEASPLWLSDSSRWNLSRLPRPFTRRYTPIQSTLITTSPCTTTASTPFRLPSTHLAALGRLTVNQISKTAGGPQSQRMPLSRGARSTRCHQQSRSTRIYTCQMRQLSQIPGTSDRLLLKRCMDIMTCSICKTIQDLQQGPQCMTAGRRVTGRNATTKVRRNGRNGRVLYYRFGQCELQQLPMWFSGSTAIVTALRLEMAVLQANKNALLTRRSLSPAFT
jgi:hypothetical protein